MPVTPPKKDHPWYVPTSIPFLAGILAAQVDACVFEWGCGGSTVWFARRSFCVHSVEHDKVWHRKIEEMNLTNVTVELRPLNEAYEDTIYQFSKTAGKPSVVAVDGRRRVVCIRSAVEIMRPNSFLVLDNSERERYKPAMDLMKDWPQWHFEQGKDWRTSIWRKP